MPTPTYLFCFDFDNTLVKGHFHNQLCGLNVSPGKATFTQIELLIKKFGILNKDELLKTFKQILEKGHKIAITTWSDYPEVIVPTLKHIGLNDAEIKQIFIASGLPEDQTSRKETHIERAKKHFSIQNNKHVVLIDDDQMNVLHAQKNGQIGILVEPDDNNALYLKQAQSLFSENTVNSNVKRKINLRQLLIAAGLGIAVGLTAWYVGVILWMAITATIFTTCITALVQKYFFSPKEITPPAPVALPIVAPSLQIPKPVIKIDLSEPTIKPIIKSQATTQSSSSNPNVIFRQIKEASSASEIGHHNMISINGLPFFQSSGYNSAFPQTWFPFFGCKMVDYDFNNKILWYVKPTAHFSKHELPKEISTKINTLFPSYGSCDAGRQLLDRFHNVPCLLLSSWLGGGLWDKEAGKELKQFLQEKYPNFYKNFEGSKPKFLKAKSMKTIKAVNQWLCEKAQVKKIEDLKGKLPTQIKSIKIQDGVTTTSAESKKAAESKNVHFAELNSQEGQRLYNIRYNLRSQGKAAAPTRTDGEQPLRRYQLKRTVRMR